MERLKKVFGIANLSAILFTLTIAIASVIGITITGFYPGMVVLLLLALIPMTSYFYVKKNIIKSNINKRNYYLVPIIINLLTMLLVLWMTFVILVDRVFGNLFG